MDRLALALALVLAASGCNAIGATATDRPTLTPAPVPEATTTASQSCLGPPLDTAAPAPPAPPATPAPLPFENERVDGSALVDRHLSALSNHSYRLRTDRHELWVTAGGHAFTYRSVDNEWVQIHAYGVGGRLYMFVRGDDSRQAIELSYSPAELPQETALPTLTVRQWLLFNVAPFDYDVVGVRTRNGGRARVLRTTLSEGFGDDLMNVTLSVDDRGIIRTAVAEPADVENLASRPISATEQYVVTEVGSARPFRPDALCRSDWSNVSVQSSGFTDARPLVST